MTFPGLVAWLHPVLSVRPARTYKFRDPIDIQKANRSLVPETDGLLAWVYGSWLPLTDSLFGTFYMLIVYTQFHFDPGRGHSCGTFFRILGFPLTFD